MTKRHRKSLAARKLRHKKRGARWDLHLRLFVDSKNGNDQNDGMTRFKAKKTTDAVRAIISEEDFKNKRINLVMHLFGTFFPEGNSLNFNCRRDSTIVMDGGYMSKREHMNKLRQYQCRFRK
jgi:hypothetical protein